MNVRLYINRLSCWIMLLFLSFALQAQVAQRLKEIGMENIRMTTAEGHTVIALEDNVYRGTYRGVGVVVREALAHTETGGLQLVLTDNGIPQICVTVSPSLADAYRKQEVGLETVYRQMEIDCDTEGAMALLKGSRSLNTMAGKVDIVPYPEVGLRNSGFNELYTYHVDLSPAVEVALWKGAELTAQVVIPIATNLHGPYRKVRPGVMTLAQELHFGHRWQARIVGGNFTDNRMGVQAEAWWRSANGRLKLGAAAGSTVQSILTDEDGWYVSDRQRVNATVLAFVYEPRFQLMFDLQAGRYVYGDLGVRADCTRHFGEYAIGVYALCVEGEVNGGFHFAIPLPGKKWSRRKAVRVRQPECFGMEYSMRSYGKYVDENMMCTYHTRPDDNRTSRFWQPDYVRHFLLAELARATAKKERL